jgi:hypothetical protein
VAVIKRNYVVAAAGVEPVVYRMNKGLKGCWYHLGTTL